MKRRELLRRAALGALAAPGLALGREQPGSAGRTPPGDRISLGMIGVGNFGTANLRQFMNNPDVEIAAICDVSQAAIDAAVALAGGTPKPFRDYRRLLDARGIDAVVITTPEHWHARMCIDACDAGKDVYVEKPVAHNITDGRMMVEAARRNNRIVQVGTQQRSGAHFQRAVRYVQDGRIGEVHYVQCWNHTPRPVPRPSVTGGPPPDLDWDMWLGPAPAMPYEHVMNVARRGSWEFWGGTLTEWGSHLTDIVLWAMKARGPHSVVAAGGMFDGRPGEIPEALQVLYTYPKFLFHYSILGHNSYGQNGDSGAARFGSMGMQFHGTKGTLFVDRGGFRITPQPTRVEEPNQPPSPSFPDMRAPGFYYTTEVLAEHSDTSQQHGPHVRNFLDSVKSRKRPIADIEDGHVANTVCRLGNIAYRVGRRLEWDADKEQVIGDAEANRLVVGTYREPWTIKGI